MRGLAPILLLGALSVGAVQAQEPSREEVLTKLAPLGAEQVSRVTLCPDGRRFTLGTVRQELQVKGTSSAEAVRGFVQVQRGSSQTLSLFALIQGHPRALTCTTLGDETILFVASDAPEGIRLTRLNADTRAVDWEKLAVVGEAQAADLTVNERGQPFLLGTVRGTLQGTEDWGGRDIVVQRLQADGKVVWTTRFGTPGEDRAARLALQGQGSLWVVGNTEGDLGGKNAGGQDAFLARLGSGWGTMQIQQLLGTPANDLVSAVLTTPQGVWLAGHTYGDLQPRPPAEQPAVPVEQADAFVAVFNNAGKQRWLQQISTATANAFTSLARLPGDRVLATGYTDVPEAKHGALQVFGHRGERLQGRQLEGPGVLSLLDTATDSEGQLYVAGQTDQGALFARMDAQLQPVWTLRFFQLTEHLDPEPGGR